MFDEMIISGLIAKGYTREPNANLVVGTVAAVLAGERVCTGVRRAACGDDVPIAIRLEDFGRGRIAAEELFRAHRVTLDMDDDETLDHIDPETLDDEGWHQLVAAIAADTFEGWSLADLRELGMVDTPDGPIGIRVAYSGGEREDLRRDLRRVHGWRTVPAVRRPCVEKWTPTGDNLHGSEAALIYEDGSVMWGRRDPSVYVEPSKGSIGPEDIRFAGSPAFTKGFKLKG